MKRLRLDNRREVTILDGAYEQILAIVSEGKICGSCGLEYLNDIPQVALNLCLECFQKKYANKQLTYVGVLSTNEEGDVTHTFIDTRGNIFYTATSSDAEPYQSSYQTLKYWGYPVPKKLVRDDTELELSTWHWVIYGDVKQNSVLYIEYDPRYSDQKPIAFLTTKHGEYEEVQRRKGKYQKLFKQARAVLEATKDKNGYYHVNGHDVYGLYDSYIYETVAVIASTEHDAKGGADK